MINIKSLIPGNPTHPGAILLDELEARGLKQQEFARQIGMQKSQLNEIIKGKRSVNAELAVLLEKALDIRAGYWLDAQQGYDLDLARKQKSVQERATALELWKLAKNFVSEKFLKAQNLISGDPIVDVAFIKKLFGVNTIDELATRTITSGQMYRKSKKAQTDPLALQTWVSLVKYRAKDQVLPPFDHKSKNDVIQAIRKLINENENLVENVRQTLNQRGIKFVHQEKADKVPVDGMSCWSEGRPLVGMTLRRRKIDNFAFTLFHELGHVYLHLANSNEACFVDLEIDKPGTGREEDEADTFARDCLISSDDWKRFDQAAEYHNPDYIMKFSKEINVHPAVLAGRSCFETGYYNWSKGDIDYAIN